MAKGKLAATAILLLALLSAGCSEPAQKSLATSAEEEYEVPSRRSSGSSKAPASNGTWYLINATSSPEGVLSTARWQVTADAIVTAPRNRGGWKSFVLEVVPIGVGDAAPQLEEWALFAFAVHGDEARLLSAAIATPYEVEPTTIPSGTPQHQPAFVEPFFFRLHNTAFDFDEAYYAYEDLGVDAGDQIAFVVAARSETESSFRLALRVLDHALDNYNEVPSDRSSALASLRTKPGETLPSTASGQGFDLAVCLDSISGLWLTVPPTAMGGTYCTTTVKRTQAVPVSPGPYSSPVDLTLETSTDLDGFSYSTAFLYTWNGVVRWEASTDLQGQRFQDARTFIGPALYGAAVWWSLFGIPGYDAIGDGSGGASTRLHLINAEAGVIERTYAFAQVTLGAPVSALLGVPKTPEFGRVHEGSVGAPPVMTATPSGLVVASPGRVTTFLGDFGDT